MDKFQQIIYLKKKLLTRLIIFLWNWPWKSFGTIMVTNIYININMRAKNQKCTCNVMYLLEKHTTNKTTFKSKLTNQIGIS